jgi:plasmid stabilization system protein ParE
LYQRVEDEIRRAILRRFPYSLFYVIEQDQVIVLACMHQHRKPKTREELTGP